MGELWVPDKYRDAPVTKTDAGAYFQTAARSRAQALTPGATAAAVHQGMVTSTPFAPGIPLQPHEGTNGMPRVWDFPTGYNIKARADREGRYDFDTLHWLTDNYEVAQLCIQHRINDVRSLDWTIVPADGADKNMPDVIALAKKILAKPDGRNRFHTWLAMYLQDVLRYDAGVLAKRRNRAGRTIGLHVVSGRTIAPVVDDFGLTPVGDAPAYVQFVNGLPWKWFTDDALIYEPFNPQPDSMYGFAPIEVAMMSSNIHLRFQNHWASWFMEGNVPFGFATLPEGLSSPEQRDAFQDAWNAAHEGDQASKNQLTFMPNGTVFEWPKDAPFDAAFPIYLMKIVCAAYGVTPADIGFTDDVNRATGETQVDVQFRVGTRPLLKHVEEILTGYLQDDIGLPVKFQFDEGKESEDRLESAKVWEIGVKVGAVSPDEFREDFFGKEVDQARPTPRFVESNTQGPIPLRSVDSVAGPVDADTAAPTEDAPLDTKPFAGTPGVLPHKSPGSPQFARAPIDADDPEHPENEHEVPGSGIVAPPAPAAPAPQKALPVGKDAGITAGSGLTGYDLDGNPKLRKSETTVTGDVLERLATWRSHSRKSVGAGKLPRRFKDSGIPADVEDAIWKGLRGARDRAAVDAAFAVVKAGDGDPKGGWRADPPDPQPQHRFDLTLTDYYQPEVQQALNSLWTDAQVGHYTDSLVGSGTAERVILDQLVAMSFGQGMDQTDLHAALTALWRDAYTAGTIASSEQLGLEARPEWGSWKPGLQDWSGLGDHAFLREMAAAGVTIKGVADTSLDLIASAVERGIRDGSPVDAIAREIRDVVGSKSRAEMIAHTETARLLTSASAAQYQSAGIQYWDLIVSASACPSCLNVASANPHGMGDMAGRAPIHPRCRCAIAPVRTNPLTGQPEE